MKTNTIMRYYIDIFNLVKESYLIISKHMLISLYSYYYTTYLHTYTQLYTHTYCPTSDYSYMLCY